MLNFYIKNIRLFTLNMLNAIVCIFDEKHKIYEFLYAHHLINNKTYLKWTTKAYSDFNFMMHELTNLY